MEFTFGYTDPTTVEVTNRNQHVEYKITNSYGSETDVRAALGNTLRGTYSFHYDGYYHNRKLAIERMEDDIKQLKEKLIRLEFAVKVTKKKKWIEVK